MSSSLVLRKISGMAFLYSVFFLILGVVIALSESAELSAEFFIGNIILLTLLVSAGAISLLSMFEKPLFALLGTYIVFSFIYSVYGVIKYSFWEEGLVYSLQWISQFFLPTGYILSRSTSSIFFDLSNLGVIAGAVLLIVSFKLSTNKSRSIVEEFVKYPNAKKSGKIPPVDKSADTIISMNSNELATPAVRLGSYLLEALFTIVTLGIGWLIWSFIVWGKGTTPGHQVVRLYVVNEKTGKDFTWGQMFVREILVKWLLIGGVSIVTFGIVFLVDSFMVVRDDRKSLHDRICGSIVVQR